MVRCLHERFLFFSFTFIPFIVLVIRVSILTRFIFIISIRASPTFSLSFVFTFMMIIPLFLHALRESAQAMCVAFCSDWLVLIVILFSPQVPYHSLALALQDVMECFALAEHGVTS